MKRPFAPFLHFSTSKNVCNRCETGGSPHESGMRIASASIPGGTFLVPGAESRDETLETYMTLLRKAKMIE